MFEYDKWWKVVLPYELYLLIRTTLIWIDFILAKLWLRSLTLFVLICIKYAIWIVLVSVTSLLLVAFLRWLGTVGMSSIAIVVRLSYILAYSHNTPVKFFEFISPPSDETIVYACGSPEQLLHELFPLCFK